MAVVYDPIQSKLVLKQQCANYSTQKSDQNIAGDFCVDFAGADIRIYDVDEAVSGTLTFSSLGFSDSEKQESIGLNTVVTVETWIPASGDISTFVFPEYTTLVDFPDDLPMIDGYTLTYHVFIARYVQISVNGTLEQHYQINYNYSFGVGEVEEEN